ncbi:MAG: tetratricopeptide repeat protein [Bdellovibrio sp.]
MAKLAEEAKQMGADSVEYLSSDLFFKATDASMRGDSQMAAFLYRHLLTLKPNDPYIKRKFALELIRSSNLADARSVLESLFQSEGKKDESIGLVLGGVYTALEQKEKARNIYAMVLEQHPKSEEACIFLAKSLGVDKKFAEADKLLNRCAAKNAHNPIFSYYQGKLAVHREKMQEAITHFDRALKIDSSYYQAAIAKGMIYEESDKDETDQRKGLKKAIGVYKQFVKNNPNNYPVLTRLVQALFATEKFDEVIPYAETLSNLDPNDLNLKVRLGILYTDKRKFDKAISVFKDILVAVPDSDKVLYYLGALYQQVDRFEDAIDSFSKIPSSSNLYHEGNVQIAQMLMVDAKRGMQKGETTQIEKFTSFVNEKSAENAKLKLEMQVILTSFYESFNKYSDAIAALSSVRDVEGYNEGHDYYLASLYEKDNDYKSARNLVREILKKNPKNAHALNFLAYSLIEKNEDLEEAYSMVKEAVSLKPDDGYIRDSLGWYYYKVGQYQKALTEIKKAKELTKDDVVITKHLAVVYKALKKYDDAKKLLVEALNYCKVESERDEVLKAIDELESLRLPASEK